MSQTSPSRFITLYRSAPNVEALPVMPDSPFPNLPLSVLLVGLKSCYFNEFALFVTHFNAIPNLISEVEIDCVKAGRWFAQTYKGSITNKHYCKRYFDNNDKAARLDDVFYTLCEDLLVYFDTNESKVRFLFCNTPRQEVESLIAGIKKFRRRKKRRQPYIGLLLQRSRGSIHQELLPIDKPKLKIEDNYNNDFAAIHKTILGRLQQKRGKGLVLLHGKPGTGKTSYIRYLPTA